MVTGKRFKAGIAALTVATGIGLATGTPIAIANQAGEQATTERSVTSNRAGQIARERIERRTGQSARVLGVERTAEYGAMWDVTVRARNGRRFDVYVASTGRVTRVEKKVHTSQS